MGERLPSEPGSGNVDTPFSRMHWANLSLSAEDHWSCGSAVTGLDGAYCLQRLSAALNCADVGSSVSPVFMSMLCRGWGSGKPAKPFSRMHLAKASGSPSAEPAACAVVDAE